MTLEAYFEMDENDTTARILDRMTDPEQIARREREKRERARVSDIRTRLGL